MDCMYDDAINAGTGKNTAKRMLFVSLICPFTTGFPLAADHDLNHKLVAARGSGHTYMFTCGKRFMRDNIS